LFADAPTQVGLETDADAIVVREALALLRRAEREVIVLRYYAGLTDAQIAADVGRPVGSVKSQIHRGLRKLEEALK
jgi:RNA polymerase sigma-70 factor (ECF subfamily)